MLFSSLCIFLALTRELPTNIPLLGVELESSRNQGITALAFLVVQVYLFFRFSILIGVDLRNWLYNTMVTSSQELGVEHYESMHNVSRQAETYKKHRFAAAVSRLAYYSRFYELILPFIYGVIGVLSALSLIWVADTVC